MVHKKKVILKTLKAHLKSIGPIIAVILLVVVAVILVTILLSFSTGFATNSLDKAGDLDNLSKSDAGNFIYPKSFSDGILQINYSPVGATDLVVITHYRIIGSNVPPVELSTPITLGAGPNIINLESLYGFNSISSEADIQLITSDSKYIGVKGQKDIKLQCTPGGTGTLADPIIICNASDLNNIRNDLDANYALGKDIDLQSFSRLDENGWEPIGDYTGNLIQDTEFSGSLNGNNHIINNLYINRPGELYIGLFGEMDRATIRDLGIVDANVTGSNFSSYGGILSGHMLSSNIENCYTTGTLVGAYDLGGLVGAVEMSSGDSTISNSYFIGDIYGHSEIGGLTSAANHANITSSYAISNIYAADTPWGPWGVGGFVGMMDYGTTISDCYASGSLSAGDNSNSVGGFIGALYTTSQYGDSIISNSYSNNAISLGTGVTDYGGFSGYNDGVITNCFWDTEVSNQPTSAGEEIGKTTNLMKQEATFTTWTFPGTWSITEGTTYPYLTNNIQNPLPE